MKSLLSSISRKENVMDKIKRFYECLIPVTACNLKCSYCYVMQRDNRKNKIANLKYSPEIIGKVKDFDF